MLPADLVVMAAGIRPNIALAKQAGLACGRGIQVDDGMVTSDPAIYAVGECVEHRGAVFGLVAPLYDMAKIVADRVTGTAESDYVPAVTGTRLKVTGIDMFSAGDFIGDDDHRRHRVPRRRPRRAQEAGDPRRQADRRGAVWRGRDSAWYFDLIRNGTDISALRDTLVFGPSVGDGGEAAGRGSAAGHGGDLRLQRRQQGHDPGGDRPAQADHARSGARPHQGLGLLRQLHLPGRKRCWRYALGGDYDATPEGQGGLQMHHARA